jgi:glutamyl-tRNA synthetase
MSEDPSPPVRVRFAPAPTGSLHVGGARTALFNWLYARHTGGTYVLRIEDTDRERSRPEWTQGIQDTLTWLGLDWDEGPHLQGDRIPQYVAAADRLVASGHAYANWANEAELEAERAAAQVEHRLARFAELAEQVAAGRSDDDLAGEGRTRSVWFRTPTEGASTFDDVIRGTVSVDWSTVADFAIVRSSGAPVFYLANAVDDADMGITHVIRGEDLLDSTHRVLALRAALGIPGRPVYAHLPLLVGEDRSKLSKRHGAVSLDEFATRGYLPEALVNYLALLGLPADDGNEIRPLDEIVADFELSRVNHGAAFFDYAKLDWVNGQYLRDMPVERFTELVLPYATERYGDDPGVAEVVAAAAPLAQSRCATLVEAAATMGFLFVAEPIELDAASWERLAGTEGVAALLDAVIAHIDTCEWTPEAIDFRPVVGELGMKPGKVMHVVFTAIEGEQRGLPIFDSIHLLGRDRALARLRAARERLAGS